jgi:gatB/yqey family protein|nr:MAG TPA: L20 Mitochondrial ribosomal protein subunit L20 [Caudoviricetes sp.]
MVGKITDEIKEKILADFHTGAYTARQLGDKYGVSHVTIIKITKGLTPKNKEKVTTLIAIKSELAEQNYQEVTSVNEVVDEATKHLIFFKNAALRNQKKADEMLEMCDRITDVEAHSRITARNKETIFGKEPQTIINNTNAQQNQITEIKRTIVKLDK